jgi:hypothetical protein
MEKNGYCSECGEPIEFGRNSTWTPGDNYEDDKSDKVWTCDDCSGGVRDPQGWCWFDDEDEKCGVSREEAFRTKKTVAAPLQKDHIHTSNCDGCGIPVAWPLAKVGIDGRIILNNHESKERVRIPYPFKPKKIYFNSKKQTVTILWQDDTRTTVTCSDKDDFSIEEGFRAAVTKKVYGNYKNYVKYVVRAIDSGK